MRLARNGILFALIATVCGGFAQGGEAGRLDESQLASAAKRLRAKIEAAVSQDGGNLRNQSMHLILALSTGHFGSSPISAEAERGIAKQLADQLLWQGDTISVVAWEMDIWNHNPALHENIAVSNNSRSIIEQICELLPATARGGTGQGHDTENVIATLDEKFQDHNKVIVLLTNTAASIGGATKPIGSDDPRYTNALRNLTRVRGEFKSLATEEFTFETTDRGNSKAQTTIHAVILVSKNFNGEKLAEERPATIANRQQGQRVELQTTSTAPGNPPKNTSQEAVDSNILGWLIGSVAALLFGWFLWKQVGPMLSGAHFDLTIDNDIVDIGSTPIGQVAAMLVGEGFDSSEHRQTAIKKYAMCPPVAILSFKKLSKGAVALQAEEGTEIKAVDGIAVIGDTYTVNPGSEHEVQLAVNKLTDGFKETLLMRLTIAMNRRTG